MRKWLLKQELGALRSIVMPLVQVSEASRAGQKQGQVDEPLDKQTIKVMPFEFSVLFIASFAVFAEQCNTDTLVQLLSDASVHVILRRPRLCFV